MTALAENGRSKLDVEVSYSSSNPPQALSTAEFINSKQEPQHESQHARHHKQQQLHNRENEYQAKVGVSVESQSAWCSKLRTVPLSIDFDVLVFATQDRHGRLTLHPVLQPSDSASSPPLPAAVQPPLTSRAVAQSVIFRGGDGGGQQEAEGNLGRNNCAKASVVVRSSPFGCMGGHHYEQHSQQKMTETDMSTATRASCSAAIGDTYAPSSANAIAAVDTDICANRPVAFDSAFLSTRRSEHDQQRCMYSALQNEEKNGDVLSLNGDDSCCCSSLTAPSPIRVKPSTQIYSHRRSAGSYATDHTNQNRGSEPRFFFRRPQQLQTQRSQRTRREDSQFALPKHSVVSESSGASMLTKLSLSGLSTDLFRVVHKLENLLDAIHPTLQGSETASAPTVNSAAQMSTGAAGARKGDSAAASVNQRHRPRALQSNIDVTNLRHEYARLCRDGTDSQRDR